MRHLVRSHKFDISGGKHALKRSHDGGNLDGLCVCKITSIELVCPICTRHHESRLSPKTHLGEAYVWSGENVIIYRREVLALIGMKASQVLGEKAWDDVARRFGAGHGEDRSG